MKISLYLNDRIVDFKLPNEISGSFSFDVTVTEGKLINVEAREGKWILYDTPDSHIVGTNTILGSVALEPNSYHILEKNSKKYLIYISIPSIGSMLPYEFKQSTQLVIGNKQPANVIFPSPYLNESFIKIAYKDNVLLLEKEGNAVIYRNKVVITTNNCTLKNGDELEIYGLRLIFFNNLLLMSNTATSTSYGTTAGLSRFLIPGNEEPYDLEIKDKLLYNKDAYFSKSPRFRRLIETKTIKLSAPPKESDSQQLPIILVVGPMLTMGISSASMLINTISKINSQESTMSNSWLQLVTSGSMLISMLLWPLITQAYNRRMKNKQKQEIITKYTAYLKEKRQELVEEAKLQKTILLENLITTDECLNHIKAHGVNFWNKRIDQNDFLTARLGVGNEKLDVNIEYPEEGFTIEESILRNQADRLVEEFKYINLVPIGYSFYESIATAIMGNPIKTIPFVHNILLQFITFYSYEDLKLVIFTNKEKEHHWEFLKFLNHTFNNDRTFRFFATDAESTKAVAEYIQFEVKNRMNYEKNDQHSTIKPHYLIIIDDYDTVKRFDFIKDLTENDYNLGFTLMILENKLSKLPSKCNNFITIGSNKSGILKNSYENQEQIVFVDEIHYSIDMNWIAKKLSNIPIEFEDDIKSLPDGIAFLEMEKVGKVEQLNILNRWHTNDSTSSLKAEVGVDERGDLMYLDLHEKYHGPHGLIAGMTGSGKSEFIITYILSMAMNYSPDDIAFILIDYKGGGLAFAFENKTTGTILPHLAGTITNLDKAEMNRTLVSIDSEIKRRQQVFNEARDLLEESTIDIYKYQKFYKEGRLKEAVPHLFIICDEFAELKSQQPDFMDNLISVARIGRSLGVHLILATQKPSGVVNDQIWSNTKFRVCLKVQDESDSKEMLKRPEAASIKQVGRFYLQVGYDEYFALGQSGWCGAKYYPSEKIIKQVNKSVDFINDVGIPIKSIQASNGIKIEPQGEQLAAIMNTIIQTAHQVNKKARKLWLDNIPAIILVSDLERKYQITTTPYQVSAILGEYDAPELQDQGLVVYNLLEDGNTIIYGNDGSEKENLLNILIYSTSKNHSSSEINYYIIDYGSESLRRYQKLPQVGGMVFASDDEKYSNLLKLIKEELQTRKKLFVDYGGEYKNYNTNNPNKLPLKVVILNNYASIYESNPNIYEELPELIRDSERYGIVFLLTCNTINSIPSKISQNCRNTYAFKLKDASDYTAIFGMKTKVVPRETEGRGLVKHEVIHEFQTASILNNETELNQFLLDFINKQNDNNPIKAQQIPTLPKIVKYQNVKDTEKITLENIPIGISKKELEIIKVNFLANLGNIITANKITNTEKFIRSLLSLLKETIHDNLIIIDTMKSLNLDTLDYPNYYQDDLEEQLETQINNLQKRIDEKSQDKGIIMIYGLNKFVSKIKDTSKLVKLTQLIKEYEKVSIIAIDDVAKIKAYNFESWFNGIFSVNEGIWIGKGLADQGLFRLSTITKEMTQEFKNDMGYYISENSGSLCRCIDFITEDEEDINGK
ncbi:MAG: type VII secretion protein EssC, partial [bacterium]|nr:type VII secretion protein EssC [bacterium]